MVLNLPNLLTWMRILAIPLFVGIFYFPPAWLSYSDQNLFAAIIFTGAAITDWLDGYLARVLNQTSAFGAFLDPVADKLMVAAALIVLVYLGRLDALIALIIIGREITIMALREWMATIGERANVKVDITGKIKTTLQMFGIAFMVYQHDFLGIPVYTVGFVLLVLAAVMTIWSMMVYLRAAWPFIKADSAG